jgi:hypothetical protein
VQQTELGLWFDPVGGATIGRAVQTYTERSVLVATMLRQNQLSFYDPADLKRGLIVRFSGDHVASIDVHYINFEAI